MACIIRARVAGRYVRHPGRWVNGVWIVNGVAASIAVGIASNCNYYYRKWKETDSSYWNDGTTKCAADDSQFP
jgi:hypothetical protein